jgi:hypothetical protein
VVIVKELSSREKQSRKPHDEREAHYGISNGACWESHRSFGSGAGLLMGFLAIVELLHIANQVVNDLTMAVLSSLFLYPAFDFRAFKDTPTPLL